MITGYNIVIPQNELAQNTEIADSQETEYIPKEHKLHQNFPNPFNPETRITYELPRANYVTLTIYNTMGEMIKVLAANNQEMGVHTLYWDGRDEAGQEVSSGVYYILLRAGDFVATKKVLFLK